MRETGAAARRSRLLRSGAALAALVGALALGVLSPWDRSEVAVPTPDAEPRHASRVVPPESSAVRGLVELQLVSGAELQLAQSSLLASEVVLLSLDVPALPAGSLPVRVLGADTRILETRGTVHADDPTWARLEIDGGWLGVPGRYVVELKTNERVHLPLRRYAIEVR